MSERIACLRRCPTYCWQKAGILTFLIVMILVIVTPSFAEVGGGSSGGGALTGMTLSSATDNASNSVVNEGLINISSGTPTISDEEGIYVWLDENQVWQVQWQGSPGQLVWVRLTAESPISDVNILAGENINPETKGGGVLTITAITNAEPSKLSFVCQTPDVAIDAKWNMTREVNKIFVAQARINPTHLPIEVTTSFNKKSAPLSITINNETNQRPSIGGGSNGGGL